MPKYLQFAYSNVNIFTYYEVSTEYAFKYNIGSNIPKT